VKNPEFRNRTKHVGARYHFIRENLKKTYFDYSVETEEQYGDIFTKPLPKEKFEK